MYIKVAGDARCVGHFAEAQLVAVAQASGVGRVLSFDKALKRATSIEWREP
jgi:predicted nucleic acid-binding protein